MVETNVKWNGKRSPMFAPNKGLHKGDLLLPYLFVLGMNKLSHIILKAVEAWKPFCMGRKGPLISHFMFADDLLLCGQASTKHMKCTLDTMHLFGEMLGQQISQEKTRIFFSKNVSDSSRRQLVQMSGFSEVTSLGNYLGIPLLGESPRQSDFNRLVNKVSSKLVGWKSK